MLTPSLAPPFRFQSFAACPRFAASRLAKPRAHVALVLSLVALIAGVALSGCGDDDDGEDAGADETQADTASTSDTDDESDTDAEDTDTGETGADADTDAADTDADTDTGDTDTGFDDAVIAPSLYVDLVDPFIGTGGLDRGNCFPGAVMPWGMVAVSPDTIPSEGGAVGGLRAAGYLYEDDTIQGFSHTRLQATSTADLGSVLLMPATGDAASLVNVFGYASTYDKETEEASPGYYAVTLDKPAVRAELTASRHAAIHRYTLINPPEGGEAHVVLDLAHAMLDTVVLDAELAIEENRLEGYTMPAGRFSSVPKGGMKTYFSITFDPAPSRIASWSGGALSDKRTQRGFGIGAIATFDLEAGATITARVGVSYVDAAGARANREAEVDGRTFNTIRRDARAAWESTLSAVAFEGGSDADREIMATALYHAFIVPSAITDTTGRYRGLDGEVHDATFEVHTNYSMWDTYRTVHPLVDLVHPQRASLLARSLIQMGRDGGYLPRWPMGHGYPNVTAGSPANIVVASSYLRGIELIDGEEALDLMLKEVDSPPPEEHPHSGREGLVEYLRDGYVPVGLTSRVVTRTLEYNVADAGIAALARAVGRDADAERAAKWATSYTSLWDTDLRVFRPRNADGSFVEPFEEMTGRGDYYYGGNAFQWSWHAPHDMLGLIALHPSREAFVDQLTRCFDSSKAALEANRPPSFYNHGDEPSFHTPFLFVAAGEPRLAQQWARWVADTNYTDLPDGLAGNDDAGAMSAWYVLASLGLYAVPSSDLWILTVPRFARAVLQVAEGELVVETTGTGRYAKRVTLDGEPIDDFIIEHARLAAGGRLVFELSDEP